MDNKVKNVLLLVLVIGLVGMTSAYAILSQNLSIRSTASVTGGSWDVHIENLSGPTYSSTKYGNTSAATGATGTADTDAVKTVVAPTVGTASISGLEIAFTKPGVSVSYTFDLVNAGTIDAILDEYSIAGRTGEGAFTCTSAATDADKKAADEALVCGHLTYTLKYSTGDTQAGADVAVSNTLDKATGDPLTSTRRNVTLTLTLEDMDSLPSADVTVSGLNVDFKYIQK